MAEREQVGFVTMAGARAEGAAREIGVGMLGYAIMGKAHTNAYKTLPYMVYPPPAVPKLVAIAGRDEAAVTEAARRYGYERPYTDWRELVADPRVELFDNGGPNGLHAEPCIAAAAAGKHILCEKPLGRTREEAKAMLDAVVGKSIKHMVGFNYRFVPAIRHAYDLIQSGALGEIYHFRAVYLQEWITDPDFPLIWRLQGDAAGSGALGDLGAHIIDLARFLVGGLASVAAEAATFVPGREVDDAVAAAVRFTNGAIGTVEATRYATGEANRHTFEVNGSAGSLSFDMERPGELWVDGRRELTDPTDWWPTGHVLGWEHTFVFELRRVLDAVAGREPLAPYGATFADGLRAAEACDAILESARDGRRVELAAGGVA